MSTVTMADLTHGTRIRHPYWGIAGTIRVAGDVTEICWDEEAEARAPSDIISDDGPMIPEDIEIIGEAP